METDYTLTWIQQHQSCQMESGTVYGRLRNLKLLYCVSAYLSCLLRTGVRSFSHPLSLHILETGSNPCTSSRDWTYGLSLTPAHPLRTGPRSQNWTSLSELDLALRTGPCYQDWTYGLFIAPAQLHRTGSPCHNRTLNLSCPTGLDQWPLPHPYVTRTSSLSSPLHDHSGLDLGPFLNNLSGLDLWPLLNNLS